jgi:chitodextrinase
MLFMFAEMENVGTGPVTPPVTPPVEPPATDGLLSSTQWQNRSIELQSGQFSAEYDVVPNVSNMNGTTGLSFANASTWDDLAVIVGFSEAGQLNVRNGAVYSADAVVPYSAGTSYHFRIVGDLASHTYSVYVTEEAGTEIRLANNYAFRSSQAAVSSLDNLAVVAVTGSHTVSNFTISESVAVDTLAPTVPAGLSTSVVSMTQINLTWTASSDAVGVEGYKIYRDGTEIGSTESTSYSDVGLIASSSYAYSLSAYDAAGNQSSQSAVVTATTEPEVDADNLPDGWEIQYFGGINAVNGSEAEDFDGDGISNYDEWQAGTDPSNVNDFPVVKPPVTDGLLSNTQWQNRSIELQSGQFSAEYDVVPNISNMNGTTGLSFGNASTWDDLAVIVGFSEAGVINVRNGGVYSADTVVSYAAGTSYHVRIVGDMVSHTYSVYVAEGAGGEALLAENYAFRTSQSSVSGLDNLALFAVTGSHTVSNFTISESVAVDTIAPTVPAGLSASVASMTQINLTWTASSDAVGVAGYKIYREGAEIANTDTSSYSDVGLSASSSYAYSLSAYDAAGNHSSQSAVVTATTAPEVDADNLPDDWEIQYFGGISVVNGGEMEDFDGDGSSNYDEWFVGTDPTNPNDLLELKPVIGVSWIGVSNRSYEIEYSDDNWKTFITSDALIGSGEEMVWIDPSESNVIHKRQYRIQVVQQ